ncbi:MAG: ATP-binding protein [bacterium]
MNNKILIEKIKKYHFEFKHLTLLFIILFAFQIIISIINKSSIKSFLDNTQEWYQKDSAERLANVTTTSLELLLETINPKEKLFQDEVSRIVQSFDIIFSQQILQHNVQELCILVNKNNKTYAIDDGRVLYSYLFDENYVPSVDSIIHSNAVQLYKKNYNELIKGEQVISFMTNKESFHIFVPFILRGEYVGALYMKNTPDFSFITNEVIANLDETSVIYMSIIILGLLAMYFISSYTVKERDDAQKRLLDEHEENLKKEINYEKELMFTNRIYHTHHKAEKVMGFIKEDLRILSPDNITEIKYRVSKYSNFISRVIYDMKWFDPPIQTIRNAIFKTNLNDLITFIVNNIFYRITKRTSSFEIKLNLDNRIPIIQVNEFVVWELLEPLIQNSIEHGGDKHLIIEITTLLNESTNTTCIILKDNGIGIKPELLEINKNGIKKIFEENVSTKVPDNRNVGYGCYIAFTISKRCGWGIDVENLLGGGCKFILTIQNKNDGVYLNV